MLRDDEGLSSIPITEKLLRRFVWMPLWVITVVFGILLLPFALTTMLIGILARSLRGRAVGYRVPWVGGEPFGDLEWIYAQTRRGNWVWWLGGGLLLTGMTSSAVSRWSYLEGVFRETWPKVYAWAPAFIAGLGVLMLAVAAQRRRRLRRRLDELQKRRSQLASGSQSYESPTKPLPVWVVVLGSAIVIAVGAVTLLLLLHEADMAPAADRVGLRLDAIKTTLIVSGTTSGIQALLLGARRYWLYEREQANRETREAREKAHERAIDGLNRGLDQLSGASDLTTKLLGLRTLERVAQGDPELREAVVLVLADIMRSVSSREREAELAWRAERTQYEVVRHNEQDPGPPKERSDHSDDRLSQRAREILRSHCPETDDALFGLPDHSHTEHIWYQVRKSAWPAEFLVPRHDFRFDSFADVEDGPTEQGTQRVPSDEDRLIT